MKYLLVCCSIFVIIDAHILHFNLTTRTSACTGSAWAAFRSSPQMPRRPTGSPARYTDTAVLLLLLLLLNCCAVAAVVVTVLCMS